MKYSSHAEFAALYKNYTSAPDSIAKHLTRRMVQLTESDPLLVVTGQDVVLFPGAGTACRGELSSFDARICRVDERLSSGAGRGVANSITGAGRPRLAVGCATA